MKMAPSVATHRAKREISFEAMKNPPPLVKEQEVSPIHHRASGQWPKTRMAGGFAMLLRTRRVLLAREPGFASVVELPKARKGSEFALGFKDFLEIPP